MRGGRTLTRKCCRLPRERLSRQLRALFLIHTPFSCKVLPEKCGSTSLTSCIYLKLSTEFRRLVSRLYSNDLTHLFVIQLCWEKHCKFFFAGKIKLTHQPSRICCLSSLGILEQLLPRIFVNPCMCKHKISNSNHSNRPYIYM